MLKKLPKILLFSILAVFLVVGSAIAVPSLPPEYEVFAGDPLGEPSYIAGVDLGYFIWTDDDAHKDWHIYWSGDSNGDIFYFNGTIYLEDISAENEFGDVVPMEFEGGTYADTLISGDDWMNWTAYASTAEDGIDFGIVGDNLGYLGFDLHISVRNGSAIIPVADYVFIGAGNLNPGSEDFKIPAPVSEPATMLLLGSGLIGLAVFGRRKLFK